MFFWTLTLPLDFPPSGAWGLISCVFSFLRWNLLKLEPNLFFLSLWHLITHTVCANTVFKNPFYSYNNISLNWRNPRNCLPSFYGIHCTVYSEFDILSSTYLMPEYRWKVTQLSEGMLIWNCQQLFWRIPWLLWSLHPTECPNFDTESHGCGYLYILWENRFPPRNRFFFFFTPFFSEAIPEIQPCHRNERRSYCDNRKRTHKIV